MAIEIAQMNPEELFDFMLAFKLNNKSSIIYFPSVIKYSNGDVYKGEIKPSGDKHGLGELYYANGSMFAARWVNDISFGSGVYFSIDKTIYRGSWINNAFHGKTNKIAYQNGDTYSGNVSNSCITGKGTMTYVNQESQEQDSEPGIYTGEFVCGQKCGYGTHRWPNGNIYTGNWENNSFDGEGILDASNSINTIYTGPWINGHQQSEGKIISVNIIM
jgi:hypothetical protein